MVGLDLLALAEKIVVELWKGLWERGQGGER